MPRRPTGKRRGRPRTRPLILTRAQDRVINDFLRPRQRYGLLRNPYDIHKFKRYTSPNNMTLQVRSASVGSFSQSNGYFVATSGAAAMAPGYFSFACAFCLADLPNYTEFTNLFDSYRIEGVSFKMFPVCTGSENPTSNAVTTSGGSIHTCIDYDDYTVPTASEAGINELRERTGYRVQNINSKMIKRFLRPRVAAPVYGAGAFTQYAMPTRTLWLDSDSSSTQHYAVKGIIEIVQDATTAINYRFKVECTYYLKFKGVK